MRKLSTLLLLLCLGILLLAGCKTAHAPGTSLATTSPTLTSTTTATSTPTMHPLELASIGRDGNVWEMSWPQGIPRQITTRGTASGAHYGGLAWSTNGTLLAVGWGAMGYHPITTLYVLSSDGSVVSSATLPGEPDTRPFIWSPDGKLIAYRSITHEYIPPYNVKGILTLFDAHTGQVVKQVGFDRGATGCGGGGDGGLADAKAAAHQTFEGLDTFTWAPDQRTMLVAYNCTNGSSTQIVPTTGVTLSVTYPGGASYQPGGTLILGILPGSTTLGPLGLVDFSNHLVRALAGQPPLTAQTFLGQASWGPDGQTIYYEYGNGIWSIEVDGTNPHQVVAGAPIDQHLIGTYQLVPSLSPDGIWLLYLQAYGSIEPLSTEPTTTQWYVAHADGSAPTPLPAGTMEAAWQPRT